MTTLSLFLSSDCLFVNSLEVFYFSFYLIFYPKGKGKGKEEKEKKKKGRARKEKKEVKKPDTALFFFFLGVFNLRNTVLHSNINIISEHFSHDDGRIPSFHSFLLVVLSKQIICNVYAIDTLSGSLS